ncbi:type I polyketide synthase [Actinosynnema mirum]|uniref:6-deoxyerythronolide-B synthase n=1 Tax=Actinosynnema mirum (strain ATCC 29888 / DSM 43827 / JCM 3225 / NBRC 14064 / NCIMB 13271 / NRRL B-12336 / IMRU 3971 / 101) TaxID=446462 RepID=C6W8V1_ACTMD|nr:type I polyketide synthase [Actinosynnema mirum]ACU37200.1 Acyl transferase [Actinosynnema mirum DSM 43827]
MLRTDLIRPVPELLGANADRFGDRTAYSDGRRSVGHAGLERRTRRLAGHLGQLRLHPGDRAMICLGNRVEMIESYFGVLRADAVAVPVNPRSTDAELTHLLADSGARLVITDAARAERFDRLRAERFGDLTVIATQDGPLPDGVIAFEPLAAEEPELPARDGLGLDDVAWMLYTSGTTGRPKGVLSTQRSCLWSVAACYVPVPDLRAEDRVLWPLPLFHSLSHITCLLAATAVGATTRIVDGTSAQDVLAALEQERSTFLAGVPTLYRYLVDAARERGFTAPDLRVGLVGGAVTTAELLRAFEDTFGVPLIDAYGSTETCGAIAVNWPTGARVAGSCGLPVPGLTVRLVDPETLLDVPAGREGEFWVSGPSVMLGYHNQPEATAEVLRDGWYRTGDLGRRDEAGFCTVTGRIKEMIIRGGENVHPGEVEAVVRAVPGVADVAVVGKPHDVLGEVPVVFVVPGAGGFDPAAVLAACREELSYFKVPEEVYEIERVPRTASGKTTRHVLLDLPARLRAASSGQFQSLLRLDWVPRTALPGEEVPASWVLVDGDPLGLADGLRATGARVRVGEPGADALGDGGSDADEPGASSAGEPGSGGSGEPGAGGSGEPGSGEPGAAEPPQVVLVAAVPGERGEVARDVEALADGLARRLVGWLADERFAGARFVVATSGAVSTSPGEDLRELRAAPLWGVVRSVQAAFPGRVVAADLDASGDGRAAALARVVAGGHDQVAVRGDVPLAPRLARVSVPSDPAPAPALDPDGLVVVTGGDSARGAALARHLVAAHGARRLLLVSPDGLPDQAAADLEAGFAAAGARAESVVCDPADPVALRALLDAQDRPVTAVVHVQGGRALLDSARALVALHELTRQARPALFVVVTSVAGLLGSAGDPARAAADQFAEALVRRRADRGLPGLAVAWGPLPGEPAQAGAGALPMAEALTLVDAALAADQGPLVVLGLDAVGSRRAVGAVPPVLHDLVDGGRAARVAPGAVAEFTRRLAEAGGQRARRVALDLVREHVAAALGLPEDTPVRADQAFRDFGVTSLTAVALRDRINAATGASLPATAVFDHPTPAALADHLVREVTGDRPHVERARIERARGTSRADEPVAIVAMGCRLPGGVASPEDLWRLVDEGVDAIGPFPTDRGWGLATLLDGSDSPGRSSVDRGGFLPGAGDFDAGFFGISPREALAMDPQQRLLLEVVWETVERAGIDPRSLHGEDVGVFSGLMYHDYGTEPGSAPEGLEGFVSTGSAGSVVSGRVAYALGLTGPALTVDTACSSSLVAIHLAAQALRSGECSMALAGGVAVMGQPTSFVEFSRQRGLAADGRCKSFSDDADGTNWAEGVGVLLLERLSDARRDGHPVLAVLRGSAVNQDGASNGLTAPSGPAQQRVIRQALANAGLRPSEVDAVEAHGTGTTLGDPIEAQALLATYGQDREQPLWLGSLKSNLGHAQAAAGVAGVIKMVMALRHGVLPRTLHVGTPSSKVDWSAGAVELLTEARPWRANGRPRRAGVSSFGVSGTNAHVVVEEHREPAAAPVDPVSPGLAVSGGVAPLVLSGRTRSALAAQAAALLGHLADGTDPAVLGRALATTRTAFEHRAAVLAPDVDAARAGVRALAEDRPAPNLVTGQADVDGPVVFVFPGQGAQWTGMGRELLETSPVFAARLRECSEALERWTGWSLLDLLADGAELDRVDVLQPASWAVMVALAALWESCGVRPDAVVGHSQGEVAAACAAGWLSLDDAARVVALRSRAIAEHLAGRGGMMSVAAGAERVAGLIADRQGRVSVAAVNGPSATVVAGAADALPELAARCEREGVRARIIPVDYASHTEHVDALDGVLQEVLAGVTAQAGHVPWLSTVDGEWVDGSGLDADYWFRNLRGTVRFADAVAALAGSGHRVFVEVSSHPVLTAATGEVLEAAGVRDALVVGSLRRDDGGPERFLTGLAELHARGVPVGLEAVFAGADGRVELPTYAFQHERYWLARGPVAGDVSGSGLVDAAHPLLGAVVPLPGTGGVLLSGRLSHRRQPWLAEHAVAGTVLLPGAAIVELAVRAGDETGCGVLRELVIGQPLVVPPDAEVDLQVLVGGPDDGGVRDLRLYSRTGAAAEWVEHAAGALAPGGADGGARPAGARTAGARLDGARPDGARPDGARLDGARLAGQWPPAGAEPVALEGFYENLAELGYEYGPLFRGLAAAWTRDGEVFAEAVLPEEALSGKAGSGQAGSGNGFGIHPALLDGALHAGNLCVPPAPGRTLLPFAWNEVRLHATGATAVRVRVRATGEDSLELELFDADGAPVASVGGLTLRPAVTGARPAESLHEVEWTEVAAGGSWPEVADTRDWEAAADLPTRSRELAARALELVQDRLAGVDGAPLLVITTGAVAVADDAEVTDPAAAAVWGLLRSAQSEHPGRFALVDVDGGAAAEVAALVPGDEPQTALRGGLVRAPRLRRLPPGLVPPAGAHWHLDAVTTGTLDGLALVASEPVPLRAGEVRIEVRAAGQNFRDVLVALDGVAGQEGIGGEGSGIVTEVGPEVTGFAAGDRVMGLFPRSFGPLAVADARTVVRVPRGWSFTDAAAVPVAFLTALHGLQDVAGLRAGETVLVHAAAGGVGQAAVQLAHHFGARVLATAHPAKHSVLTALGVPAERLASSRDLGYARRFGDVDVVLNSLVGEHVDASLRLLRAGGRFVEIGKNDVRDADSVGDVRYRVFDLGADAGPDRIGELLEQLVGLFESGALRPLPVRTWDVTRAASAFREMSRGGHTGKIVLTIPRRLDPEGTVLITGGAGTLGATAARHLVTAHGARNLLLVGRRGPDAPGASELAEELRGLGADVRVAACDVADRAALDALLASVPAGRPLTAVVHAAGALDDGTVTALTPERFDAVFRPKVDAIAHLDEATRDADLAAFVVYSSAAGVLGNAGQGNYAAANAVLDAVARTRHARALPATSLAWGLWSDTSALTATMDGRAVDRTRRAGVLGMGNDEALAALDAGLASGLPALVAARIDPAALRDPASGSPLLRGLVRATRRTAATRDRDAVGGLAGRLAGLSAAEQDELLLGLVRGEAAAVLGHASAERVEPQVAFRDMGFDSLTAVELRNRLAAATGLRLPATATFDHPTPVRFAALLRGELLGAVVAPGAVTAAAAPVTAAAPADEPIAIVSMACRLPGGVVDPAGLWELLTGERDGIVDFPDDRGWDLESLYHPDADSPGTSYVLRGGFLDDAGGFDAGFFGISPREALAMDPQQRVFLETCWEAFERAGIDPVSVRGSDTGVFAGIIDQDYGVRAGTAPEELEGYLLTGTATSVASGRVAYLFGLEGPAVTVDTACSSSLVATHWAVQALRRGECSMALAGGATVMGRPSAFVEFSRQRGLARDGNCKAFGADADGTAFSEGAGVLLLERLSDARRRGHPVLAVIRGSALNQDGASNGLTAPSGPAQQRVIRAALADAGLRPSDVDAVEAHGTGTALGDPIEAGALLATYGADREGAEPVWLGSLKSNTGHTLAAAGVSSVIKMVLALNHGLLPRSLHVREPSAAVDWESGGVRLLTSARPWPESGRPRRAGVSSFGISGTNAHLVLEAAPAEEGAGARSGAAASGPDTRSAPTPDAPAGPVQTSGVIPWPLSARSADALPAQAAKLAAHVRAHDDLSPLDVGWSLATTRTAHPHRAVLVGGAREALLSAADALAGGEASQAVLTGSAVGSGSAKTVFVFPGQGAQWAGMGRELLGSSPVFAARLRECADALAPHTDWDLLDVVRGAEGAPGFERVDVLQPTSWAVMVALAALWRSCGVEPSAVVGHSQGEVAAAVVGGYLALGDAARLIARRSRAIAQELTGRGGMLSVLTSPERVAELLEPWAGKLWIAAVNSPASVSVSGDAEALGEFVRVLAKARINRWRLPGVDFAGHSGHVDGIEARLREELADVTAAAGEVPWLSTVDGRWVERTRLDADYWYRNLRDVVRFDEAVRALVDAGHRAFVEVSTHPVLTTAIGEVADERQDVRVAVAGTLRRDDGGADRVVGALGEVAASGVAVDWAAVFGGTGAAVVELPTYAFRHERFWLTPSGGDVRAVGLRQAGHPLLGAVVSVPDTGGVLLTGRLSLSAQPWLADHALSGVPLLPGTALVELVVRAGDETGTPVVAELVLGRPLVLPRTGSAQVQVLVGEEARDGRRPVAVYSRAGDDRPWTEHASGSLAPDEDAAPGAEGDEWPPAGAEPVDLGGFYDGLAERGYDYGPAFRGLVRGWVRGDEAFAEVGLPDDQHGAAARFGLHPALLDAALHAASLCAGHGRGTALPFTWTGVRLHAAGATALRVRVEADGPERLSLRASDPAGTPVVTVGSLLLRAADADRLRATAAATAAAAADDGLHALEWTPHPLPEETTGSPAVLDTRAWELPEGVGRAEAITTRVLAELQAALDGTATLVVVTRGAVAVHDDAEVTDPAAAAVWGLVRAAQAEEPGRVAVVDVDDASEAALDAAAHAAGAEPQLALRGGAAFAPRLVEASGALAVPDGPWRLDSTGRGTLENLALVPNPAAGAPLAPGQVRIVVRAGGLNFRDVLIALDAYESEIGTEGAGVVVEVAPDVTRVAVGDRVMGMIPGSFGPLAVADARTVVRMPRGWSFTDAAGVPVAFLTALYGLRDLGGLAEGETVLVHAAAGGVGMAAVQLARHFGARVLGTAHPAKHAALDLPADHLASSRDLAYAQRFGDVDVVLNSLVGEHVDASLRLLRAGGRFVEMGRADLRDADEVAREHPGRAYLPFDLGGDAGPDRIAELLVELVALFESGALRPLPTRRTDLVRAPEAFRAMSQGRHVGKLVLTPPRALDRDGTVLITGGTGTLGAALARHLVDAHGVRHLLLVSRSGPDAPGAADLVAELAERGARVRVAACDVAEKDALTALLASIPTGRPLTGVVHAAGALDDGVLTALDADRVAAVLRPKADAALLLHEATEDADLALFALCSSVAGVLGNAGQANYAAANTYLDALAQHRSAAGLAGLSLAWGRWAQTSALTADLPAPGGRRDLVRPMDTASALRLLDAALRTGRSTVVAAELDVTAATAANPVLRGLVRPARRALATSARDERGVAAALAGLGEADRRRFVLDLVRSHAAVVLGLAGKEAVDAERAFTETGFDSLTAVELRNRLAAATGLRLPSTLVFDHATPTALAAHLRAELTGDDLPQARAVAATAGARDDDPVVIVSASCRLPGGADSPEALWELLERGRDAITPFPRDRGWDLEALYDADPDRPGKSYVRDGGFLADAAGFDAEFFGISPREALATDPQQRLLAETSWELFERAGIAPTSVRGSDVGVFAGVINQEYGVHSGTTPAELEGYVMTGSTTSIASGRVAYLLGLTGPAVTVDTACSSSLVAIHLAAQALRSGECSMAIAGGATVIARPGGFVSFSRQRGAAPDGRCKAFGDGADGMAFAEGVGLVLLERLSDARRNGHPVLAVVRGTALNQDGASNGLTAPNGPAQQRVIRQALANAGLSPDEVDAVDAHGTGTALGDPIEAQALLATYGRDRDPRRPLWLGSVKSNIGHTQAAAGIASVLKMVLAMQRGVLPATLHADTPTTKVDWSSGAVALLSRARPWPETGRPRRAGVSSFGISGTNAHVLLEQAPQDAPATPVAPRGAGLVGAVAWPVSGRTPAALRAQAARLGTHLAGSQAGPADVGWSLAGTRTAFAQRAVVVAGTAEQARDGLAALAEGRSSALVTTGEAGVDGRVVFVFPGQGAQWIGMGAELLDASPVFAERLRECAEALDPFVDFDLIEVLRERGSLERVDVVQPASWAVMVSLAALWRSLGVEPDAVVGHSQGEIAAAAVSGALSLPDAAAVVALRSKAIAQDLAGLGGMMSVALPADDVDLSGYPGRLWVAALNGPTSTVVAGDVDALRELHAHYEGAEVRARIIPVDYASHTGHVDAIRERLAEALAHVRPRAGTIPWLSTATGEWTTGEDADGDYWFRNLRGAVGFHSAITTLAEQGHRVFVEVSSHPVLTTAIEATLEGTGPTAVTGTLRRDDGGPDRLLTSLATLHVRGVHVDWDAVYAGSGAHRTTLPTYAFQHERYWLTEPDAPQAVADAPFWDAVDSGDVAALAGSLGVEPAALEPVLPGLTSWRARNRDGAAVDDWSYRIGWERVDVPAAPLSGTWLVVVPEALADDTSVAEVAAALAARGATPRIVAAGPDLGPDLGDEPDGVLSLLAWDDRPAGGGTLSRGVVDAVGLVREAVRRGWSAPLWCATLGAVAVADPGEVTAEFGPQLWGTGVVLGLDLPDTWGGLVDLPARPDGVALDLLCAVVAGAGDEDQLAVRPAGVFARRMTRRPVASAPAWRPRGTVLVTGGTGGLGGYVARWAAERGARDVVLLSRGGPDAPGADALVADITAAGARCAVLACDVTDRDALAEVVANLPDGPLSVVHAAGVARPGRPLVETTPEEFAAIGRGKVAGARLLDELLGDRELDAFVLFSSGAAAWGSGGQAGYAAGNAFLDGLAQRRRARGLAATSVAWGAWGGVGTVDEVLGEQWRRAGLLTMDPRLATLALAHAVGSGEAHLLVADVDWARFAPAYALARPRPLLAALPEVADALAVVDAPADAGGIGARLAGLPPAEQERLLTELVQAEAAAVLGLGGITGDRAFREVGFDSLTAVELRNRLGAATGLTLPATLVFDHPRPSALAAHLRSALGPAAAPVDSVAGVLAELDRLEAAIPALPSAEIGRSRLELRLRRLSARVGELVAANGERANGGRANGGRAAADELDDAGAEDVLAFIDREFGDA